MAKRVVSTILGMLTGAAAGAVAGSVMTAKSKEEILTQRKKMSDKHFDMFLLMNQWLILKQEGKDLATYFEKKNYKKIAIYGMSYVGERLFDELKKSDVEVCYAVDRRAEKIYVDLDVYTIEDDLPKVDVVVVTAIHAFGEIKDALMEKMDAEIVSIEDICYGL